MTKSNENYVLDTNIIIASFSRHSPFHWIFRKLIDKEFDISVTNEIIEEYAEKITEFYSPKTAKEITEFLLVASNVRKVTPYFRWNLITADPDDNKFVDCAIVANADLIVTNDRHFNTLRAVPFPRMTVKNLKEFSEFCNMPYLQD